MMHFTDHLLTRLAWIGLAGLILLALLMTTLRLALPITDHYRDAIVQTLSQRLGYPLRVETLTLRLSGWFPRLVLGNAALTCPENGSDLLRLQALELDLEPIASLRTGKPQIHALTLVGARLIIERKPDGRVSVAGLGALHTDDPRTLELFLDQGRLNLTESEVLIRDDALGSEGIRLTDVRLRLHNTGLTHQLELIAQAPTAPADSGATHPPATRVRVLADLQGDARDLRGWGGRVYLHLAAADPAAWLPRTLVDPDWVHTADVRLESWNEIRAGALTESINRIDVSGLTLTPPGATGTAADLASAPADSARRSAARSAAVTVEQLGGLIRVAPLADGWRIGVADLELRVDGAALHDLDLDLRLSAQGNLPALDLTAAEFDLATITKLLRASPWPSPLNRDLLAALGPRGRIERLALQLAVTPGEPPTWRAAALGHGLALEQRARLPGFAGLSARLRADQDGGGLQLGSTALDLDLRPLLDQPIHLDQFSGFLTWQHDPAGGVQVQGRHLVLENADLSGRARLALDWPAPAADPATGPVLDLRAHLSDADVAQVRRYLPVGVIKPELTRWLTRALAAGRVPQADLLIRGPLKKYPFREQEGRFELLLDYQDLVLDYQLGWPPIVAAAGELRFLNQGLDIRMDNGRIYDTVLTQGRTAIPDLWRPTRMLIHGEGAGPFADGLRLLGESPLARHLGPLARVFAVQGRSQLVLDLDVPLIKGGILGVDGRLSWLEPASLSLTGTPVALSELNGELRFTGNSLQTEAIRAKLWGRPVTVAIATRNPGAAQSAATEIRAHGRMPVTELAARFPTTAWRLASGDLDWDLDVDLRNADLQEPGQPLALRLHADLRGLGLDLPPPFGKTANQLRVLELTGALVPGRSLTIQGGLDGLALDLDLGLGPATPRLERGRVTLGTPPDAAASAADQSPTPARGLVIDGTVTELSLPTWSDWWKRVGPPLGAGTDADAGSRLDPLSVDLRITTLDLGGPRLTDTRVQTARLAATHWDLQLDAKEAAGHIRLPVTGSAAPLNLDLERLDLKALLPAKTAEDTGPATPARRLPAVDLRVADLRWGEARLGRLSLDLRPDVAGLRCSRIRFDGLGETQVTGDADWMESPAGGRSRLSLDLAAADTGPLLHALDYSAGLSPAAVNARLRLGWPGGFESFDLARSQGRIELDIGPGRLLAVEPGVGRVLGFLNLGEIGRRLTLDFSDLYEQGFVFESILGRIDIADAQARLERFEIDGPASDISVSGFTDLRARTFDQTVTVEPSIGTSVALASTVAGGPVVGAAVYLLDRVSGGALDRLGSYQYRMTGPWAKPQFTRIGWEPFAGGAEPGAANAGAGDSQGEKTGAAAAVRPNPPTTKPRPSGDNSFLE
ncbi:MAG: TIGR02099 family protein [Lamprocystis purpurea]|nr:TIGR02099 family protein [Lamprocystis purpurea]